MLDFLRSDLVPVNALIFLGSFILYLTEDQLAPKRKTVHRHQAKVINSNFKFSHHHHYSNLGQFWQSLLKQHSKPPGPYLVLPYPGKCFLLWIWKTSQTVLFFFFCTLKHEVCIGLDDRVYAQQAEYVFSCLSLTSLLSVTCIILLYDYY